MHDRSNIYSIHMLECMNILIVRTAYQKLVSCYGSYGNALFLVHAARDQYVNNVKLYISPAGLLNMLIQQVLHCHMMVGACHLTYQALHHH